MVLLGDTPIVGYRNRKKKKENFFKTKNLTICLKSFKNEYPKRILY